MVHRVFYLHWRSGASLLAMRRKSSVQREDIQNVMRKYEAMVIARPDMGDADVQKLADRYKTVIEDHGGAVDNAGKWDKRKLAYEIDGHKEGNYVLFNFSCPPTLPIELNRLMRINDDIIRHRIFSVEE